MSVNDLNAIAGRFGVADEQVRRDHAISHILAVIAARLPDEVIFFGGTALSRTHLTHARLSEDIDLIATGPRRETIEALRRNLDAGLAPILGHPRWNPQLSLHNDIIPAVLETGDDVAVKIQLLNGRHYSRWPVERRQLDQRYADAPPAELTVPTIESFVGWKTAAWHDRGTARDLYDLWALASDGHFTAGAAELFAKHGTTGVQPRSFMFAKAPTELEWRTQLATQTRLTITAADAIAIVRASWARALGEAWY